MTGDARSLPEITRDPQYIVEGIILRRLHDKRIDGYTIETAKEIVVSLQSAARTAEPVCNCGALFPNDVHHSGCLALRSPDAAATAPVSTSFDAIYDALGDVEVDDAGKCRWSDIANIQRAVYQMARDSDGVAQVVPNRHTIIEAAIRSYCRRQSSAAVQEGRIYYAGLSITDLVNDIEEALSLPSTEGK